MRCNAFAGALLPRAALLSSSFIMPAPLLAQEAAPRQPIDQNNTPQQPADQNNETAPRQESGPSVGENVAPDLVPETVRATTDAARRYMEIAARGGWPRLARALHPGATGSDVARLRRRLGAEGYPAAAAGSDWDEGLTDAVKRFQANHGLDQTGDVSRATLRELNIPAAARAKQLEATTQRLSRLHFNFPQSYVAVNIAGASVEAVEDRKAVRRFTAIVGGKRHESPPLTAKIVSVDINPTWTVPASIIKKEMAPRLRRDPNYLARRHIRVLDGRGHEVDPRKYALRIRSRWFGPI
jgi:L,D-transpeptidase YcbB